MKITNPITLDVARSNSYICLLAKQFDENSRFLIATLTNNGAPMIIPAGAAVTLRATRPDGEPVAVPGIINNDGTTTVEIDDYILEVVGSASLSIEVAIGDEILTSASFNLTIQRADGNGWLRVYVAAASLAAGNYYITIGDTPYAFTTTQAIPAGGSVYFASEGGTAQTRDASGNVLDASLTLTAGTSGTELTSDVPTMSFLTAIAGRMATIEAEMSQKADIDGSYPLLHAGTADNLMTDNGATQAIPFIQEGTGKGNGEATVKAGGVLQLKKKLGNTVGVNQGVKNGEFTSGTSNWQGFGSSIEAVSGELHIYNGTGSYPGASTVIPWIQGHSVLLVFTIRGKVGGESIYMNNNAGTNTQIIPSLTTSKTQFARIFTPSTTNTTSLTTFFTNGQSNEFYMSKVFTRDLTLWYGSNDRIPSDLLSHPENWGRYYAGSLAYNAGTLVSADGSVLKSISRNCFGGTVHIGKRWQNGSYVDAGNSYAATDDLTAVSPNTEYAFALPQRAANTSVYVQEFDASGTWIKASANLSIASARYATYTVGANTHFVALFFYHSANFVASEVSEVDISRYYSGESGYGQHYPYSVLAEVDTGSEVLRSAGSVADEKTPDGTITRKVGYVDLGDLTWTDQSITGQYSYYSEVLTGAKKPSSANVVPEIHAARYIAKSSETFVQFKGDKAITMSVSGRVNINDNAYTTAAALTTALSGVYLYYELATPTTEQGTAFAENIPCDPDGTLNWTQSAGVPQGNEIFYPADLKGALESIVAALPSANGTYTLHATVTTAGVTFSWS